MEFLARVLASTGGWRPAYQPHCRDRDRLASDRSLKAAGSNVHLAVWLVAAVLIVILTLNAWLIGLAIVAAWGVDPGRGGPISLGSRKLPLSKQRLRASVIPQ
jgi:hypothetical protein